MGLPAIAGQALSAVTRQAYRELAEWLSARHRAGLRVLGINGSQGSGKSTLAAFMAEYLAAHCGLRALPVALDDFYLGRAARAHLGATVHPLLVTRGVPATHDVQHGIACLRLLRAGQPCALPAFSKANDEALGREHERLITEAPDLVIFEGWCVGTPPQEPGDLTKPVNDLERQEDADGRWRRHVNDQLAGPYAQWFAELDALVHLQIPAWDRVRIWRGQQERETAARNQGRSFLLDEQAHERFLQHYQRLTEHALAVLPRTADAVLQLDMEHNVAGVRYA